MRDDRGATSIEYALVAILISILIVAGATAIGTHISTKFLQPVSGNLT